MRVLVPLRTNTGGTTSVPRCCSLEWGVVGDDPVPVATCPTGTMSACQCRVRCPSQQGRRRSRSRPTSRPRSRGAPPSCRMPLSRLTRSSHHTILPTSPTGSPSPSAPPAPPAGRNAPCSPLRHSPPPPLATHEVLGGTGTWLLALPAHHIAGLQVLIRSLVGGTQPSLLDLRDGFTAAAFARAAEHRHHEPERAPSLHLPRADPARPAARRPSRAGSPPVLRRRARRRRRHATGHGRSGPVVPVSPSPSPTG